MTTAQKYSLITEPRYIAQSARLGLQLDRNSSDKIFFAHHCSKIIHHRQLLGKPVARVLGYILISGHFKLREIDSDVRSPSERNLADNICKRLAPEGELKNLCKDPSMLYPHITLHPVEWPTNQPDPTTEFKATLPPAQYLELARHGEILRDDQECISSSHTRESLERLMRIADAKGSPQHVHCAHLVFLLNALSDPRLGLVSKSPTPRSSLVNDQTAEHEAIERSSSTLCARQCVFVPRWATILYRARLPLF